MPPETTIPGVYVQEVPSGIRSITGAPTDVVAFVGELTRGPRTKAVEVRSMSEFERQFGRGSLVHTSVFLFFENGGRRAVIVRQRDSSLKAFFQALNELNSVEDVNLLCLPSSMPLEPDKLFKAVSFCEKHRIFLLLDPDPKWSSQSDVTEGLKLMGVSTPNASIYFPRLLGQGSLGIPPCGAIAGVIARMDREHGVWRSPAGLATTLRGVRGLILPIDDTVTETLGPIGVNCLREDPTSGTIIWGARTLAGNDNEWRYIAVRRLSLFIEESIYRGTKWVVFEPNAEPLWLLLRQTVGIFMISLFNAGAFQGARMDDAFFVKCDATTMTQNDIQSGRVNIIIGFAPLKPAEFTVLRFSLQAVAP